MPMPAPALPARLMRDPLSLVAGARSPLAGALVVPLLTRIAPPLSALGAAIAAARPPSLSAPAPAAPPAAPRLAAG
jgi:hypothetical protein